MALNRRLGALRDVSYQLFRGSEILESAFEQREDRLCVVRQLSELLRLPYEEVYSDFDAICPKNWERRGVTGAEIREFCVWRKAPLFIVNCRGQMLDCYDCYEPPVREQRPVACCIYRDHAFFYRNAGAVSFCDAEPRDQPSYRGERRDSSVPLFRDWKEWRGEIDCAWPGQSCWAGARRACTSTPRTRRCSGSGWPSWTSATGASASPRPPARSSPRFSRRAGTGATCASFCALCGTPIDAATAEADHIVPVHQAFYGQRQALQALCLECHRSKTFLETSQATSLESRFCRHVHETLLASAAALVCGIAEPTQPFPCRSSVRWTTSGPPRKDASPT